MTTSGREPRRRLDERFDFADNGFSMYMRGRDLTPEGMLRYHDSMADSEHPLVRYAAGWAAAEFARTPAATLPVSLERRIGALQMAREQWVSVEFEPLQEAQKTEKLALEVKSFEVRLLQALANMPAMEVAASWFANEPMDQQAAAIKLRHAQSQTLSVAQAVNDMPKQTDEERKTRAGLAGESACQLIGQSRTGEDYILLPSSLRQDNNSNPRQRADILAIMNDPGRRAKLLQVRTGTEHGLSQWVLDVHVRSDLISPATRSVYGTITSLALLEKNTATPRVVDELDALHQALAARISDFPHSFSRT